MPPDLPRFVPTLTEVVTPGDELTAMPAPPAGDLAQQIALRVLQRIDAALEESLAEAVQSVIARHTQALLPALREEIAMTVQAAVAEALADEITPAEPRRNG